MSGRGATTGVGAPHPPVEREVKLAVPADLPVPDLGGVAPGLVAAPTDPHVLDAVYWDTADLRLIRSGVSLRHRTKDGGSGTWTVKVPARGPGGSTGALVRTEIDLPGEGSALPGELVRLVAAHARSAALVPVTRLRTTRRQVTLRDASGEVGELDDDLVEVLTGDRVVEQFRELEVEVGPHVPEDVVDAIVGRLRIAGASVPDPTPKVARALGASASRPPDLVAPEIGDDATVVEAVSAAIATATLRIVAAHPVLCLTGDPAAAHALRVSARRIRTLLRLGRSVVDPGWSDGLPRDLRWLAESLEPLCHLDATLRRVDVAGARLARDDDREVAGDLARALAAARPGLLEPVAEVLGSARYGELLERLVVASTRLPPTSRGERPARVELRRAVRHEHRRLTHLAVVVEPGAPATPDEVGLGSFRTAARRVRDGAALLTGPEGSGARRLVGALSDVTRSLGERADALRAAEALRAHALGATAVESFVAGRLVGLELDAAERAAGRAERAWRRAGDRRATRWLG